MMKSYLLFIPVAVGVITGIFLAVYLAEDDSNPLVVSKLIDGGSPILGDADAQITILEWGDYQCTYCYRFHQSTLDVIYQDHISTGKVRLIFKDFPLNGPDSRLAAEASYCADDQGRYWQYHDEIYRNWGGERTGWITRDSLDGFASDVGLNLTEFNACLDEQRHQERVEALYEFGREIGIDATPVVFGLQ